MVERSVKIVILERKNNNLRWSFCKGETKMEEIGSLAGF